VNVSPRILAGLTAAMTTQRSPEFLGMQNNRGKAFSLKAIENRVVETMSNIFDRDQGKADERRSWFADFHYSKADIEDWTGN